MATLEQKIAEAIQKQTEQYMREYQKTVRVTLLEPYAHNKGVVTMRFGSTEARVMGQAREGEDDEVIDMTQRPRKIIPGRPIHYHLSYEPVLGMKCECQDEPFDIDATIIMPQIAAEIYFGHWQKFSKIYSASDTVDTADTVAWQKKLVASQWGGYAKRHRSRQNYVGDDWRSLESVGIPAVPNVEVVRLDTQLRKIPNSEFQPWQTYDFQAEVVADIWSEKPGERVMTFTEDQLRAFIAAEVARGNNLPQKAKTA